MFISNLSMFPKAFPSNSTVCNEGYPHASELWIAAQETYKALLNSILDSFRKLIFLEQLQETINRLKRVYICTVELGVYISSRL